MHKKCKICEKCKNGGGVKVKEELKSNQAITLIALVITLDTIGIIAQMEI